MSKRRIFISAISFALLLAAVLVSLVCYKRDPTKTVVVQEGLKPVEVSQIQRDYSRLRWSNFHKAVAACDVPFILGSMRDLAFGRIRGIGSPMAGYAVVHTGYVWNSRVIWVCDLTLTTNGWTLP